MVDWDRWESRALPAWLLIGAVLRLGRAPLRWGEATWDYASYHLPLYATLRDGGPTPTWSGLHPPGHDLLMAGVEAVAPVPLLWLGLHAGASVGALLAVTAAAYTLAGHRAATLAAAAFAVSPVGLAYSCEVLAYPWVQLFLGGLLWALATGRGPWVVICGALAGWSQGVGAVATGGAVVGWMASGGGFTRGAAWLVCIGLSWIPLARGALAAAGGGTVHVQVARPWAERLALWWARFGASGVAAGSIVVAAAPGWGRSLGAAGGMIFAAGGGLVLMLAVGVAATHQFQYLSIFTPALAVLVGVGLAVRPVLARWVQGVMLILAGVAAAGVGQGYMEVMEDLHQPRAVDVALGRAAAGDEVWLMAPHRPDDDKAALSPVFWRVDPWARLDAAEAARGADHRRGQARRRHGVPVRVFSKLFQGEVDALVDTRAPGSAVWIVLSDLERQPTLGVDVAAWVVARGGRPIPVIEPGDQLWWVPPASGAP